MLKYQVETVPEGLEDYYETNDQGINVLKVEGVVPESKYQEDVASLTETKEQLNTLKSKVDEFRSHNVALRQELEAAGKPVDKTATADVEELINQAIQPVKEKNEALLETNTKLNSMLEEIVLSDKVKELAVKHGVQQTALTDVINRAKATFTVNDGKPIPTDAASRDSDGNLITPETWMEGLTKSASHLFTPSSGSGARRPAGGTSTTPLSSTDKIKAGLAKL